ncbi:esterase/lipase family protein [Caenimonas sedimenti]|uniref:esterase/lipase family protein n=1 Tax=Caenimonas sedimenti TaxID=2596921 RepID=UPI001C944519|nr:alpha/beta hydrolase [Caenimonas sedimenti]
MQPSETLSAYRAPSLTLLATEPLRALFEFVGAKVGARAAPVGDGHPVVVYPGLGGGALSTSHLRRFLRDSGFDAHDWGGGVNTGPEGDLDPWLDGLVARVRTLHAQHGRKVSLVGWSLGGVFAREVAKRCPESVRQVITLGTPFNSMDGANHAGTLYKLLGGDTSQLTPEMKRRLSTCPNVPTTSVYSRHDGVVCWQGCLERVSPLAENIEVHASHLGMGTNAQVLRIVADRLAQPEGRWRPYQRGRAAMRRARRTKVRPATSPSR